MVRLGPRAPAEGTRRRARFAGSLLLLVVAAAFCAVSVGTVPRLLTPEARLQAPEDSEAPAADGEAAPAAEEEISLPDPGQGGLEGFVTNVAAAIQPLQEQVAQGSIVPQFGAKAAQLVQSFSAQAGEEGPQLAHAVDDMLHTLFLRQLTLLRRQIAATFEAGQQPIEALLKADDSFVTVAEQLKRPGSDWSYDQERYTLKAILESGLKREEALAVEGQVAAEAQQATVEIISKLQNQMEALQQKVQAMRAGSPLFMSASWRIPRTPFNLIARHQQGRTNLELSLNQDRDPANSEAGMVQGFGPMNLGMNLNVGA